ncbi:hypothetical protein ANANG_G00025200 [Anguilla anguilla]|uniref:Uncharacterized protein n=1 Tax=Anguilla anguilla TaxID=7936 RepID=A0A9D3MZZ8_ANGAN|nr:hypothetical protein ANANG_G00025200 [Anguilla anguilla]
MVRMTKIGQVPVMTSLTLSVFERPLGSPICSVGGSGSGDLQYRCNVARGQPPGDALLPSPERQPQRQRRLQLDGGGDADSERERDYLHRQTPARLAELQRYCPRAGGASARVRGGAGRQRHGGGQHHLRQRVRAPRQRDLVQRGSGDHQRWAVPDQPQHHGAVHRGPRPGHQQPGHLHLRRGQSAGPRGEQRPRAGPHNLRFQPVK